jgi:hypothetical protein
MCRMKTELIKFQHDSQFNVKESQDCADLQTAIQSPREVKGV